MNHDVVYHPSEKQNVALRRVGPLVLAQAPEVAGNVGEQTRARSLQFSQALARHGTCLPVRAMVRAVDDDQQQFNQALGIADVELVERVHGDENGGGGDEHLVFESEGYVSSIGGGLD